MKFKFIYFLLLAILVWTVTNSRINAVANLTTYTDCKGCHTGTSSTTSVDSLVLVEKSSGLRVTKYNPSTAYTLTFYGHNSASLNKYGFQLRHNGKGVFSVAPSSTGLVGNLWLQSSTLTGVSSKFTNSITWTSPVAGVGPVNFDMYLNAVDGNGSDNNLDVSSNSTPFIFLENTGSSSVDTAKITIAITTGTNPSKSGELVKFTATAINGGTSPQYQWIKNGVNLGTASSTNIYSTTTLANKDTISCKLISNLPGVVGSPASSTKIIMTITNVQSISQSEKSQFDISIQNNILRTTTLSNKNSYLEIYNLSGEIVYKSETNNDKEHDISSLAKALYITKVQIGDKIYSKKFSIQ